MKSKKKIAFIGSGRMAEALISGLISAKIFSAADIIAADKDPARLKYLREKYKVKTQADNRLAVKSADIIVLSVKPQVMLSVLEEIGSAIKPSQLAVSIAAGITLKVLEKSIYRAPVLRAMPNNPALIGEGMTAICVGNRAEKKDQQIVEEIFDAVGKVIVVEEKLMSAVTALSGSGPAFIHLMVEAFIEAGIEAGLSGSQAMTLTIQTFLGTAKTLVETGKHPSELREMVTSPGGTTIAGLRVLEEGKFKKILAQAVLAAAKRAKEISEQYEK